MWGVAQHSKDGLDAYTRLSRRLWYRPGALCSPRRALLARCLLGLLCLAALPHSVLAQAAPGYTLTTLVNFTGTSGAAPGASPYGTLTLDSTGNLYGTTQNGGGNGTLFRYSPSTSTFTNLVNFTGNAGAAPGANPYGALTLDGVGNLYGTTIQCGSNNLGTVFRYTPSTNTFATLVNFTGTSGNALGSGPRAGVTLDSAGSLYGATAQGGSNSNGTLFRYSPSTNTFTNLVNFTNISGNALGANPFGALTLDGVGNLYGTTYGGGIGVGTLFRYSLSTSTFTTLVNFDSGNAPVAFTTAGVTLDGAGNLYGTTQFGGSSSNGTVFRYSPATDAFTILAAFTGASGVAPGSLPYAGVTLDSAGNLYGTTQSGGGNNLGTVFRLSPAQGQATGPEPGVLPLLLPVALGLVAAKRGRLRG